jgi:hypothetical protein
LLLAIGAPKCFPEEAKFEENCLDGIVRPVIQSWGETLVKEHTRNFKQSLCTNLYAEDHRSKLLPPAASTEDLENIAKVENTVGDSLLQVLSSLGRNAELLDMQAALCASRVQSSAAKVVLAFGKLPAIASISTAPLAIDPMVFTAMKSLKTDCDGLKKALAKQPEETVHWTQSVEINSAAEAFLTEKFVEIETRFVAMFKCGDKALKVPVPKWRDYTLTDAKPEIIKAELIDSDLSNTLTTLYPACAACHKDAIVFDRELDLHLKLKNVELWRGLRQAGRQAGARPSLVVLSLWCRCAAGCGAICGHFVVMLKAKFCLPRYGCS